MWSSLDSLSSDHYSVARAETGERKTDGSVLVLVFAYAFKDEKCVCVSGCVDTRKISTQRTQRDW